MEILNRINQLLSHNEPFCLATVVSPPPWHAISGTKVIVRVDGSHEFTTGMDGLDELIVEAALRCFNRRRKLTAEVARGFRCSSIFPPRRFNL